MTIWYDVSGLVGWQRPHLGGIERTTAGILAGLHELGVPVRLVHLPPGGERFVEAAVDDLPAAARGHGQWPADRPASLRPVAARPAEDPPPAATPALETPVEMPAEAPPAPPSRRRPIRDALYGPGPDGVAFRSAWHAFKAAGRDLLWHAGRRAGVVRPRQSPATAAMPAEAPPALPPEPDPIPVDSPSRSEAPEPLVPFAAGDVLLSLGGTFAMPGHPRAVEAARGAGVGIVRMVYDLIPQTKPQWVSPHGVFVHWLRHVVAESDLVLAISEFTRQELLAYCRDSSLPPPATAVVRLGDVIRTGPDSHLPSPLPRFVPQRPFFLCVSTLDARKNHRCLYEAWAVLTAERGDACPDLLCTGMPHTGVADLVHEIRHDPVVNRHLHLLDGIRDAELEWYYRHCIATIYPSKHEGWGLPVAESLAHGKLCLASSASSIPEIDPRLPEFFAPHDVERLVTLVRRAVDDPAWVTAREAMIRREFRATPWSETARAVLTAGWPEGRH